MPYPFRSFDRTGRRAAAQGVASGMTDGVRAAGPRAVIDLAALRANVRLAARCAQGRECIAVVKADAYGHGAVPVARELLAAGAARLAVFTADEAVELRTAGLAAPILVLAGARDAHEADAIVAAHASAVLHHEAGFAWMAEAARRGGRKARVQLEVDTGMRRMGVPERDAVELADRVVADAGCELEGVFTHFACADDPDPGDSLEQCARFRRVLAALDERGVRDLLVHASNSAALLTPEIMAALPEATAVRPGLMLYGVPPAPHLAAGELAPAMSLRAPVVRLHDVARGEGVGYGASWRAGTATRVATVALGYEDGLAWTAGNRGAVWLAGERRSIVGRVSMDSVGVEIGDAPVAIGDEAVFFGPTPDAAVAIRVEEAAATAGTLHYELLVRVGRRVRRDYVNPVSPR
jgi:alanine racemase